MTNRTFRLIAIGCLAAYSVFLSFTVPYLYEKKQFVLLGLTLSQVLIYIFGVIYQARNLSTQMPVVSRKQVSFVLVVLLLGTISSFLLWEVMGK